MASDATKDLNKLIQTCLDGKHGYQQAAEHASSPELKSLFADFARQRDSYATALQQQVKALGGTPAESGSASANLHRGWIGLKNALTSGDKSIVEECIRGDESAVKEYQEVLSDDDVPADVKTVAARQHGEIEAALATLNSQKGRL